MKIAISTGLLLLYFSTIPIANWMIGNVGTQYEPGGPHVIPVGLGFEAPSGVLVIGLALVLRDAVHMLLGTKWTYVGVLLAALLSGMLASPSIAIASSVSFLLGETLDLLVYLPLKKNNFPSLAIALSGTVGAVADSALFLLLAFGSLEYITGQVIGKVIVSLLASLAMYIYNVLSNLKSD